MMGQRVTEAAHDETADDDRMMIDTDRPSAIQHRQRVYRLLTTEGPPRGPEAGCLVCEGEVVLFDHFFG